LEDVRNDVVKASAKNHAVAMPAAVGDDPDALDVPTKCVSSFISLSLKAQIQFIDFEGK